MKTSFPKGVFAFEIPSSKKVFFESFATFCNQYLEKNNLEKRVDHRSFERQGIEEIPTIHLGASASALERKGIETDKGNINREIKKHNSLVKTIRKRISELTSCIGSLL